MEALESMQVTYHHDSSGEISPELLVNIQRVLDILLASHPHQGSNRTPLTLTKEQWHLAFFCVFRYCEASTGAHNCRYLYQYVRDRLTTYVDDLLFMLSHPSQEMVNNRENLIKYYCESWKTYHGALKDVDSVLSHLNRNFVKGHFVARDALHAYEGETCINECLISIKDMGFYLWKNKLNDYKTTMFQATRFCINKLRTSHDPGRINLLRDFQDSLELLDDNLSRRFLDHKYQSHLSDIFIRAMDTTADEQYTAWRNELSVQKQWLTIMETLLCRLDKEQQIFDINFIPAVWQRLSGLFFEKLVRPVAPSLQTHGITCIQSGNAKQLHGLFRLLLPIGQCEPIYQGLIQTYLKQIQTNLDKIGTNPSELKLRFFQALNESYTSIETMINTNFSAYANELFRCMDTAFTIAINSWRPPSDAGQQPNRSPLNRSVSSPPERNTSLGSLSSSSLMVKYIHNQLKHPRSSDDLLRQLDRAVKFVSYLQEKDSFMRYYVIQFNRRLLENFPAGKENESKMLHRLHPIIASTCEIGSGRPARMLKDYAAMEALNKGFLESLKITSEEMRDLEKESALKAVERCNMTVCLVTSWAWSLRLDRGVVKPPHEYSLILREFTRYYQTEYKHRRIQWMHSYGIVEVLFHKLTDRGMISSSQEDSILLKLQPSSGYLLQYFDSISMNGRQAAISHLKSLFTNNSTDSSICFPSGSTSVLSVSDDDHMNAQDDINESPDKIFASALEPLVKCGLFVISEDKLCINEDFTCPNKMIDLHVSYFNCPEPKMKRSEQVTLLADRRLFLECCIMRIMKQQGQVAHDSLLQQVQEKAKLRFQPTVRDIKDVIGSLIERGFLQRSSANMDLYEYCK